jgi:hypothetical protein
MADNQPGANVWKPIAFPVGEQIAYHQGNLIDNVNYFKVLVVINYIILFLRRVRINERHGGKIKHSYGLRGQGIM